MVNILFQSFRCEWFSKSYQCRVGWHVKNRNVSSSIYNFKFNEKISCYHNKTDRYGIKMSFSYVAICLDFHIMTSILFTTSILHIACIVLELYSPWILSIFQIWIGISNKLIENYIDRLHWLIQNHLNAIYIIISMIKGPWK